tara:strand:- start:1305 stop:2066 length:762 start_codon:yes stop_codon:yes gene_type:complete
LNKYYTKLSLDGYNVVKIPRYLINSIKKEILNDINQKISSKKFKSYNDFTKFIKKIPDEKFIKIFGNNLNRILNAKITKEINLWVEKNIPSKINSKKAALNLISKNEFQNNKLLKKNQFSAFYRVVRKNKNDVGHPHRDSSFWKMGETRDTYFKHNIVWKLWIPVFGVSNQNTLNMVHASHTEKIKISYVMKNGKKKPKISKNYITKNIKRIKKPIKDYVSEGVLFHKDMVHFANVNKSSDCRISVEFNILAK